MIKERLYSPKDAAEILGVCTLTIKRWDKDGKINTLRTPNGRRRIAQSELNRLLNIDESHEEISDKDTIEIYARVSSTITGSQLLAWVKNVREEGENGFDISNTDIPVVVPRNI